jgi:hypothetical protein
VSLKHTVYFMSLVGALAGLACWTTQVWLSDLFTGDQERHWLFVGISATLMGAFIGGMTVGFADHWTSDRVVPSWTAAGVALGATAGVLSAAVYVPIERSLIGPASGYAAQTFGRALAWWIAGGLIGLAIGVRWATVNPLRAVHSMIGGLVGGALGGLVAALAPPHEFSGALAYMLTGTGITCGVTIAPVLLKEGTLAFISSRDARAQNKYASPRQEWLLQDGDRLVVGSQTASAGTTMIRPEVQIYLPDAMVAARHAVLMANKGRFFLQPHADNLGPQGQPVRPLTVGNTQVVSTRELRHGDEIVVGQTLLRFLTARKTSPESQAATRGSL